MLSEYDEGIDDILRQNLTTAKAALFSRIGESYVVRM